MKNDNTNRWILGLKMQKTVMKEHNFHSHIIENLQCSNFVDIRKATPDPQPFHNYFLIFYKS